MIVAEFGLSCKKTGCCNRTCPGSARMTQLPVEIEGSAFRLQPVKRSRTSRAFLGAVPGGIQNPGYFQSPPEGFLFQFPPQDTFVSALQCTQCEAISCAGITVYNTLLRKRSTTFGNSSEWSKARFSASASSRLNQRASLSVGGSAKGLSAK